MGIDQSGHDDPAPGVNKEGFGVFAFDFPGWTNFHDHIIPDGYASVGNIRPRAISRNNPAVSNQQQAAILRESKKKKCFERSEKYTR